MAVLGCNGVYWAVLGYTWLYWALPDCRGDLLISRPNTKINGKSKYHSNKSFGHFVFFLIFQAHFSTREARPYAPLDPLQIVEEKIGMPHCNCNFISDLLILYRLPFLTLFHVTFDSILWENGFTHGYQSLCQTWILLLVCEKVTLNEGQATRWIFKKNIVKKRFFCHCVTFWKLLLVHKRSGRWPNIFFVILWQCP